MLQDAEVVRSWESKATTYKGVQVLVTTAYQALLQRPQSGSGWGPLHGGHHVDWAAKTVALRSSSV